MATVSKKCKECGNEFEGRADKEFCSSTCRSIASNKRKYGGMGGSDQAPATGNRQPVTDAASAFIISELQRTRDRLQKDLDEKTKDLKETEKKLAESKEAFEKFKTDKQIEGIQNEKPGGLNGFLESSAGQKILELAGPTVIEKLMKFFDKPEPAQIAGVDGSDPVALFAKWFNGLPDMHKAEVWAMLQRLSTFNEMELGQMMAHLKSIGVYAMAS